MGFQVGSSIMQEIENLILNNFEYCLYESGGEIYIPINEVNRFVTLCVEKRIIIYTIEIFEKSGTLLIPYSNVTSIDSSSLFVEELSWRENVNNCNLFIQDKVNKMKLIDSNLYFAFVLENENLHF